MNTVRETIDWCWSQGIDPSEHADLINELLPIPTHNGLAEPSKEMAEKVKSQIRWRIGECV